MIIPEYQGIGTTTGQDIAAALAGKKTVEKALQSAQDSATPSYEASRLHQVEPDRADPDCALLPRAGSLTIGL